jgi:hypothetical protein
MQVPSADSLRHRVLPHPGNRHLLEGDHPVLPRRQAGNRLARLVIVALFLHGEE